MLDCLNKTIGYIRETCDCLPAIPESIEEPTASSTGLYITDLLPTDFTARCSESSVWTILKDQLEVSKLNLSMDLMKKYSEIGSIKTAVSEYGGKDLVKDFIGNDENKDYGFSIRIAHQRRNVYLTVSKFMFHISASNGSIQVYDQYGATITDSQPFIIDGLITSKWQVIKLETEIKLPLWTDDDGELIYYFIFSGFEHTKQNESDCVGCAKPSYAAYFELFGCEIDVNVEGAIPRYAPKKNWLPGVRPHFNIECDFESLICTATKSDINAAAIALYYLWAINTLEFIINSGNINLFTALGGEYLEGLLQNHTARYHANLKYLCEKLPTGECVICDPKIRMKSHRI